MSQRPTRPFWIPCTAAGLLALLAACADAPTAPDSGLDANGPRFSHGGGSGAVIVSETSPGTWQFTESGTAASGVESGPATPPLGGGSAELRVGSNGNSAAQLRNTAYAGTLLSSLDVLKYSTYVDVDGSGGQAPYILLNVDYTGDGVADDFLFFEPVYQTASFFPSNPQPALVLDTWQQWDALNGGWWSVSGTGGATPGTGVKPLSAIIAAEPDATIVNTPTGLGGLRVVAGFGAGAWDNFVGNVDAVTIGVSGTTVTFDFDLIASKNDCKNGGWAQTGAFRNQGECVSRFAKH